MTALSVILCLDRQSSNAAGILDALVAQSLDPCRFELIVVGDDGADDLLSRYRDRLPLRFVRQRPAGTASARNLGIFLAQHPVLLFLTDDDLPGGDYLVAHLAAHIACGDEQLFVVGTLSAPSASARSPFTDLVLDSEAAAQRALVEGATQAEGCRPFAGRFSCKRTMLIKHGIYDTDFGDGFEHFELEQRLAGKGRRWTIEPLAVSALERPCTFDRFWLKFYRWSTQQVRHAADRRCRQAPLIRRAHEFRQGQVSFGRDLRHLRKADHLARTYAEAGVNLDAATLTELRNAYARHLDLAQSKAVADGLADGWECHRPLRFQSVGLDRVEVGRALEIR